jgi:sugar phosphate isomerase/epimerase
MRLGTCLPWEDRYKTSGRFDLDRQLDALAAADIRACLYNFPPEESEWEKVSLELEKALHNSGITLLEFNSPRNLYATTHNQCQITAEKYVDALAISQNIGCLNVSACVEGPDSILPDPYNRSQEAYERLKVICLLIAEGTARRNIKARLLLEPVYTTILWSPLVLARFIDEIDSPNVQAHMDVANFFHYDMIFDQAPFIRDAFTVLRDRIHSAHIKDVAPVKSYFPGLVEMGVGEGIMDYRTYLHCLSKMPEDFPVIIEHMADLSQIVHSYRTIKSIAEEMGILIWR